MWSKHNMTKIKVLFLSLSRGVGLRSKFRKRAEGEGAPEV